MDPDAALRELCVAAQDRDIERAEELFEALDGWLGRGGYAPAPYHHVFSLHNGQVEFLVYAGEDHSADSRRSFMLSHHDLLAAAATGLIPCRLERATT
jgi:hypothetical protein